MPQERTVYHFNNRHTKKIYFLVFHIFSVLEKNGSSNLRTVRYPGIYDSYWDRDFFGILTINATKTYGLQF